MAVSVSVIPTQNGPDAGPQLSRVVLSGQAYQLRLGWNERAALWSVDVLDTSGAALAGSLPVSCGPAVNGPVYGQQGFPAGILMATPTTADDGDAGLEELGARVVLAYQSVQSAA